MKRCFSVVQVWSQLLVLRKRVVQCLINEASFMVHLKVPEGKTYCPGRGFLVKLLVEEENLVVKN